MESLGFTNVIKFGLFSVRAFYCNAIFLHYNTGTTVVGRTVPAVSITEEVNSTEH